VFSVAPDAPFEPHQPILVSTAGGSLVRQQPIDPETKKVELQRLRDYPRRVWLGRLVIYGCISGSGTRAEV